MPLAIPGQLVDGDLILRAFTRADAARLAEIVADPDVRRRHRVPEATREACEAWIDQAHERAAAGAAVQFAICLGAADRLVGRRGVRLDPESLRGSVGCFLAPEARGQRLASRSARLLAAWAFSHWPIERLDAECDLDNLASYKSLLRAGFRHEGVRRSYIRTVDGSRRDQHVFGLLPEYLA